MSTSGRGRSVFFSSVALGMSALSRGGPTLRSSGSIQLHTLFFMRTFRVVFFFLLFYFLLSFFVVLTIFWEWERKNEVWWIGMLGRSERNWERGTNLIKYIIWKGIKPIKKNSGGADRYEHARQGNLPGATSPPLMHFNKGEQQGENLGSMRQYPITYYYFLLNAFPIFDLRKLLSKVTLCGYFIFECIIISIFSS